MEFIACTSKSHRASGSKYPKNKVPRCLFRKYPDKSESTARHCHLIHSAKTRITID